MCRKTSSEALGYKFLNPGHLMIPKFPVILQYGSIMFDNVTVGHGGTEAISAG